MGTKLDSDSGANGTPGRRFAARLELLPQVQAYVAEVLRAGGLTAQRVACAELILEELFRNSVLHGYAGVADGEVWLVAQGSSFSFEDAAAPFNPLRDTPPPAAPVAGLSVEAQPVGGVGLLLIRGLGRAVSYARVAGRNRIVVDLGL
jgi:anti-sigma regulatory factor (Ser/Thr protein kinase)